jgi:hypothetical protein
VDRAFVTGLAGYFRHAVPGAWPADERPDNWQTSAWLRRAALGDGHFDSVAGTLRVPKAERRTECAEGRAAHGVCRLP